MIASQQEHLRITTSSSEEEEMLQRALRDSQHPPSGLGGWLGAGGEAGGGAGGLGGGEWFESEVGFGSTSGADWEHLAAKMSELGFLDHQQNLRYDNPASSATSSAMSSGMPSPRPPLRPHVLCALAVLCVRKRNSGPAFPKSVLPEVNTD